MNGSNRNLNRRLKGWPGWVALALVVAGLLAVGISRDAGPQTQQDRIDSLTRRVACPICQGESVYESRNNASESIRAQVGDLVRDNELSDAEILAVLEVRYRAQVLLVPKATGFDAIVWVLPAVAFVCAIAGLVVTFRRWRADAAAIPDPTDDDRALVDAALAADPDDGARPAP